MAADGPAWRSRVCTKTVCSRRGFAVVCYLQPDLPRMMIDWNAIDTVFLDLDGTLLDLHFDNYFWREYVPRCYARAHGLPLTTARTELHARYRAHEGTLAWYCVDHWSRELDLDIAQLKREVAHLITLHPRVIEFLKALAALGKQRVLVTNAHPKSIALKMEKTRLADHFEHRICSHDLGLPKEADGFWPRLQTIEPFDRARTLFVDDSLRVLRAAKSYGFHWLLAVLAPGSRSPALMPGMSGEFPAIRCCADLLPDLDARIGERAPHSVQSGRTGVGVTNRSHSTSMEEPRKARERKRRAECDDPREGVGPSVSSECGA